MSEAVNYAAYGLAALFAVHGTYSGKVQEACMRVGSRLEGATGPTGFQDAITPPETTRGIMLNWAFTVALLAFVWWQVGFVVVAVTAAIRLIGKVIAGVVFSSDPWQRHFVRKVYVSMVRRQADYTKNGDTLRAEALKDLLDRFDRSPMAREAAK